MQVLMNNLNDFLTALVIKFGNFHQVLSLQLLEKAYCVDYNDNSDIEQHLYIT